MLTERIHPRSTRTHQLLLYTTLFRSRSQWGNQSPSLLRAPWGQRGDQPIGAATGAWPFKNFELSGGNRLFDQRHRQNRAAQPGQHRTERLSRVDGGDRGLDIGGQLRTRPVDPLLRRGGGRHGHERRHGPEIGRAWVREREGLYWVI